MQASVIILISASICVPLKNPSKFEAKSGFSIQPKQKVLKLVDLTHILFNGL